MKLEEFRNSYHNVTEKASNVARNTNYSLIAVIWILCDNKVENIEVYKWPILFLLLSLASDYLQYLIMALIGAIKYRYDEFRVSKDARIDNTDNIGYPNITPWISNCCFILKFTFAMIAVICLLTAFTSKYNISFDLCT